MKLPSFNRIVFYFFIIGCLYIIQLSSQSEKYSGYTSALWIAFMFLCLGLYWLRKKININKDKEE